MILAKISTLVVILGVMVLSVAVFATNADGAGIVWRAVNKAGSSIYDLANVAGGCANGQVLKFQTSNSTFICQNDSGITAAVTSINADTTAAQLIQGVAGNTTVSTSTGTTTINTGSNVVVTGGSAQTITKGLTLNSGTLGGSLNANNQRITSLGTPTATTDAARANTLQTKSLSTGTCTDGSHLKYQSSNSTWICDNVFYKVKTADETVNNSVTLQNDNDLFFSIGANEIWRMDYFLRIDMTATADFKHTWTVPAGAIIRGLPDDINNMGDATAGALTAEVDLTTTRTKTIAATTTQTITGTAIVVNGGTAGTVQYQWAQNALEVANLNVKAGSHIILTRLN